MISTSVIVPVYNVEKYLDKCLESVLNQTLKNIEIILVNDGSIDNSGEICDKYGMMDTRVKVIHKENGGLSDARNVGMLDAKDEYILFLDADDWIKKNTINILYQIAKKNNLDIVTGEYVDVIDSKSYPVKNHETNNKIISGAEYLLFQFQKNLYNSSVCINLFKRKFLIENKLTFLKGIIHEDEEWTPRVFLKAKRVIGTGCCFYNRLVRENSIMTEKTEKARILSSIGLIQVALSLKEEVLQSKIQNKELEKYLCDRIADLYLRGIYFRYHYFRIHKDEIDYKTLKQYSWNIKRKFLSLLCFVDLDLFYHAWLISKKIKYLYKRTVWGNMAFL